MRWGYEIVDAAGKVACWGFEKTAERAAQVATASQIKLILWRWETYTVRGLYPFTFTASK